MLQEEEEDDNAAEFKSKKEAFLLDIPYKMRVFEGLVFPHQFKNGKIIFF